MAILTVGIARATSRPGYASISPRIGTLVACRGRRTLDVEQRPTQTHLRPERDRSNMTESVSESENPAIPSPTPEVPSPRTNHDWWPNQLDLSVLHRHSPLSDPMGEDFDYAKEFADPRPRGAEGRPDRADEHLAGLVARRLRPLRTALHPHELARRRHLPHRRRPRWRRQRRPALRAAQQLARQREPRQGAPAAVADQAEVRPQDLLGRPARLHRQRRDGVDGLPDVRLRLRPRGHLGGRGDLLGQRGHLARRRALQRRARARQARSAPCRWASSTSTRRARTATRTRWRPPRTSARPSPAWR